MINAPIPGESLTTTPKNATWESPPKTADPEEALYHHLEMLTDEVRLSAAMNILEEGVSIQQLTEGIVRNGVAQGIHSIDVSLMVAPVIHEYLKGMAETMGIDYDEGEDFGRPDVIEMGKQIGRMSAKAPSLERVAKPAQEEVVEAEPVQEETPQESKGLMSRPEGV